MAQIFLSIEGIKQDLKQGLTRLKSDPNYDPELGSIEEKYNLNKTQVQTVFKDSRLKGLRTIKIKNETEIVFQEDVPSELNATIREESLEVNDIPESASGARSSESDFNSETTNTESVESVNEIVTAEETVEENNTSDTDPANSF